MKNIKKYTVIIIVLFAFQVYTFAQQKYSPEKNLKLTGNLHLDSEILQKKYDEDYLVLQENNGISKKSPVKAGLFSLLIPGAGQVYNHNFIIAAAFVVAEAALITTAVIYNNKGDNKTTEFENYAKQHWSVKRYAQWTLDNLNHLNPNLDKNNYNVFDNQGNVVWQELNRLESDIGDGYSHVLPFPGEQQYYEEIGKYPQYSHGWDDSNPNDIDYHNLSPNFRYYSGLRGDANDLYNISTKAVAGIYINHVLSAMEAVWGATRFNKDISMKLRVNQVNLANRIELVPTMNFKINF